MRVLKNEERFKAIFVIVLLLVGLILALVSSDNPTLAFFSLITIMWGSIIGVRLHKDS